MAITEGFAGRRTDTADLPPGQHLTTDFPVLSAGPTQVVTREAWELTVATTSGQSRTWDFAQLTGLPVEDVTVDLHCVTGWSKLRTRWRGVPVEALLADTEDASAEYVMARSYGGYTTNLPLGDLVDGRAWLVFEYEHEEVAAEHGGPVRLLVPHLYLWKSAKWVNGLTLMTHDEPGFWETFGYHLYGDPWQEQRYSDD
jgi:DMSO/TMAO reductase YedYZ molybdopterin-dependent catalytic subunit